MAAATETSRSAALVTLGCVRNEVDSEELAGRLAQAGWRLAADPAAADVVVVNTCGFVEQAKKDSVDALLEAAGLKDDGASRTRAVVAVGCLAERYGTQLADALPEADAVLGFDSYAGLSDHLAAVLRGERPASHTPADRRRLLPVAPAERQAGRAVTGDLPDGVAPASGPRVVRRRLDGRPWAPLKLATGCDRRCSFCAIPAFRGAFVSRRPAEVLDEARWLAGQGVREVYLVSENSTSYGKDLGDVRLLEALLPELAAVEGLERVRVSYLQPAEVRPGLLDAMTSVPGVVPYFDLSFQHSSPTVLRRMRRFGGTQEFLGLLDDVRRRAPEAGVRSNVIVGFPGETEEDLAELERFLVAARLDVVGVFGYSDEEGTEAAGLDGKLDEAEIAARVDHVSRLVEELTAQRAEERVGSLVEVLVEEVEDGEPVGRAAHQGPDVDGVTRLTGPVPVGDLVTARVVGSEGVDLLAEPGAGA
ncbi:30S ribosomal protein S12 methylthiotransferase RimO [Kineosporiaceae bacterium SCSIO 59966]|nr:30S ribosomal protein S12 methylthiotransferase RimO [Kineosporiaceae bacterium SCSIO 59966]